jgi:hypothetical protein
MNRRALLLLLSLLAAACASAPGANIPKPKVQIIARTNLAEVAPSMATGIAVHYELRITNVAEVPVTFTRADLDSMGGGGFTVQAKTRLFNVVIPPGETVSADFDTTAFIADPLSYESRAPVAIRAQLLFDSPLGKVTSIVQQRVSMYSGD